MEDCELRIANFGLRKADFELRIAKGVLRIHKGNFKSELRQFSMKDPIGLFISEQLPERQNLLKEIHNTIIAADKTIIAEVDMMMGKQMIVYKAKGFMKYALASVKNYMSLHVLPIYGSPVLYSKYKARMIKASFQKGCINFVNADEMPIEIVQQLIKDCSTIDLQKIREEYLNQKKQKSKK